MLLRIDFYYIIALTRFYLSRSNSMAIVSDGFDLRVNLADTGGKIFPVPFQLVAADAAAAATAAATILTRLAGVSALVVAGYSIAERFIEDALVLPTAPAVEGENKARLVLQLDGAPNKKHTMEIPGAIASIFQAISGPGYDTVDLADVALQNYISTWHSGGLATLSDGENVDIVPNAGILAGKRVHKKSNFG